MYISYLIYIYIYIYHIYIYMYIIFNIYSIMLCYVDATMSWPRCRSTETATALCLGGRDDEGLLECSDAGPNPPRRFQ